MFSHQHQNAMNVSPRLFECENLYQQQRLMGRSNINTSSFRNQFMENKPNSNDSSYANIFSRVSKTVENKKLLCLAA